MIFDQESNNRQLIDELTKMVKTIQKQTDIIQKQLADHQQEISILKIRNTSSHSLFDEDVVIIESVK
jgi:hypothetical protein